MKLYYKIIKDKIYFKTDPEDADCIDITSYNIIRDFYNNDVLKFVKENISTIYEEVEEILY